MGELIIMNRDYNITEMLYSLTKKGYRVEFSEFHTGMLTVTYGYDDINYPQYSEHIGTPHQSMRDLQKQVSSFLSTLYAKAVKEEEL